MQGATCQTIARPAAAAEVEQLVLSARNSQRGFGQSPGVRRDDVADGNHLAWRYRLEMSNSAGLRQWDRSREPPPRWMCQLRYTEEATGAQQKQASWADPDPNSIQRTPRQRQHGMADCCARHIMVATSGIETK